VLDLNRVICTLSLQAGLGYITTKAFWLGALHFLSEFFYCSISLPKSMSYYCWEVQSYSILKLVVVFASVKRWTPPNHVISSLSLFCLFDCSYNFAAHIIPFHPLIFHKPFKYSKV